MILKLILFITGCLLILVLLKQLRPEYAFLFKAAVLILSGLCLFTAIHTLIEALQSSDLFSQLPAPYFLWLLKILCISLAGQITTDVCKDCGELALATVVDLLAKLSMLLLVIPLMKEVLIICKDWMV